MAVAAEPDATEPPTDETIIKSMHAATAHTAPDTSAATAFDVPAGTQLIWIGAQKDHGFYRVIRNDKGPQGWVAADGIQLVQPNVNPPDPVNSCVADLDSCPARGCAVHGSGESVANELKRTTPTGPLRATLSFGDIMRLQTAADERMRQGPPDLSPQQRKALSNLTVGNTTVSEGDRVRLLAYLAKGGDGLHVNGSGESVNCMLPDKNDNDFHIPVVEHIGETDFQGIVVEMIPQNRPPAWNIEALKQIQAKGAQVWVEGSLFYDNVHYVSADPGHPLKEDPNRKSLWEIHPITKFLVCRKDHCDPDQESDWSALDASSKTASAP